MLHHEVLKFNDLERSNFSERQFFSIVIFMKIFDIPLLNPLMPDGSKKVTHT